MEKYNVIAKETNFGKKCQDVNKEHLIIEQVKIMETTVGFYKDLYNPRIDAIKRNGKYYL